MNMLGCLDVPTAGDYYLAGVRVNGLSRTSSPTCATRNSGSCSRASTCWRARARSERSSAAAHDRSGKKRDTRALAQRSLDRVASASASITIRANCRAASSSAWRLHARSSRRRPCCSRRADRQLDTRTSMEIMALFQELNEEGVTILIVTHEPDVACYAKRLVEVRDGRILRDEPMPNRRVPAKT